jgi:hypothetical protein
MSDPPPKRFNTTGPCVPEEHYMIPVLPRLPGVNDMVEGKFYFVLHAPRQSGKTTSVKSIAKGMNSEGKYYALYCTLESLQGISDDMKAMKTAVALLNKDMFKSGVNALKEKAFKYDGLPGMDNENTMVTLFFNRLCDELDKELVVFFDEADCLSNEAPLITFLRQIRSGYNDRADSPESKFPRSMALIGLRDIRDYLARVRPEGQSVGLASPFNIKKKALTLGNFTENEIRSLYFQHTEATGQVFAESAIAKAWHWSEGQPRLVNALADAVISDALRNDFSVTVTGDHVDQAAETLIRRRDTHIDSLLERLREPRVKNVMESVLTGTLAAVSPDNDDSRYCRDLGLLALTDDRLLRPSNPLYEEVIVRTLTDQIDKFMPETRHKTWTDGKYLLINELLREFQAFWRRIADARAKRLSLPEIIQYDEANHVIILFSFLQRALNDGAAVFHEYAEGRGSVDLCAVYKEREYLVEVKLEGAEPLEDGLAQLSGYLDTSGENEGWLVIFDKDQDKPSDEKFYEKTELYRGKTVHVFGC